MRYVANLLAVFVVSILVGCSTTEPTELKAEKLSMEELTKSPGYSWFSAEMSNYVPNTADVSAIASTMAANPDRTVCIFVRPTCSCRGTQRLFPQIVKSLVAANVDMSRVEIWSMRNTTDSQPYPSRLTITELPSIYVFSGSTVHAKVSDRDYTETNASELISKALQ